MSRRRTEGEPSIDAATAIGLLRGQVDKGEELLASLPVSDLDYDHWKMVTRNYLERAFGVDTTNVRDVINYGAAQITTASTTAEEFERRRAGRLRGQVSRIEALIELLNTDVQLESGGIVSPTTSAAGHNVFLIHGHDAGTMSTVARFVEGLGLDVTILHEQANEGRTIIEKFEHYAADVGFAFASLVLFGIPPAQILVARSRWIDNAPTQQKGRPRCQHCR